MEIKIMKVEGIIGQSTSLYHVLNPPFAFESVGTLYIKNG